MTLRTIGILPHGGGNIGSIINAFRALGYSTRVLLSSEEADKVDLLVVPGVGHAGSALKSLQEAGSFDALAKRKSRELPILGICLGAQLFTSYLEEANSAGLGWLQTETVRLENKKRFHNGWFHLDFEALSGLGLSRGLSPVDTFYFNHEYKIRSDGLTNIVCIESDSTTVAIFVDGLTCGVQFHPEKSQRAGQVFLRNLIGRFDES